MSCLALHVFVDALGWRIAQRSGVLSSLCSERQELRTVLGYSSTCDPTILTGLLPREHDHFTFFRWDPERSPFRGREYRWLQRLPRVVTDRARVRNRITRALHPRHGFTGYFNLYSMPFDRLPNFDYTERRDLYAPGGIRGGQPTIFDRYRAAEIPFVVSDWRKGDAENLAAMEAALVGGRPRVAYLYLSELDGILHRVGTSGPEVDAALGRLESGVARLLRAADEHYDEVVLRVFSDHGMTDVRETHDVEAHLAAVGLVWGRDYVAAFDSTMARFWFPGQMSRARFARVLDQTSLPGHRMSRDEIEREGIDFADEGYGEEILLMDPGVLIVPSDMGRRAIRGMHGYTPDHIDSAASLLSNRPVRGVRSLTDLHELMWMDANSESRIAA